MQLVINQQDHSMKLHQSQYLSPVKLVKDRPTRRHRSRFSLHKWFSEDLLSRHFIRKELFT